MHLFQRIDSKNDMNQFRILFLSSTLRLKEAYQEITLADRLLIQSIALFRSKFESTEIDKSNAFDIKCSTENNQPFSSSMNFRMCSILRSRSIQKYRLDDLRAQNHSRNIQSDGVIIFQ